MKNRIALPVLLFLGLAFFATLTADSTRFYCYRAIDGDMCFYVRLPVVQPKRPNGAVEALSAGFVALGALIPRKVAFVDIDDERLDAPAYLERVGAKPEDRLIIQFRPGIGFFAGVLPPGTRRMSQNWMVSRSEEDDVSISGGLDGDDGDAPMETFPVVVIISPGVDKVESVDDVSNWYHHKQNDYFDENGKLREEVFDKHKSDMRVVYLERNNFVESFLRFRGCESWDTDEIFYETRLRKNGLVYAAFSELDDFTDIYAIGFECLTGRQGEYVRKGKLGRIWQTIREGAGRIIKKGLGLLGQ